MTKGTLFRSGDRAILCIPFIIEECGRERAVINNNPVDPQTLPDRFILFRDTSDPINHFATKYFVDIFINSNFKQPHSRNGLPKYPLYFELLE